MEFQTVQISRIEEPTDSAKTIFLDLPGEKINYRAGQFITIEQELDGEKIRRSYSLSSSPLEDEVHFTVKKVDGGNMSTFLCERIDVGDSLSINLPPEGRFIARPRSSARKDHYFFAAGSGITPIISMIKTLLEEEAKSCCYLLYGNKSRDEAIYLDELHSMAEKYKGQLFCQEIFSNSSTKSSFLSRIWPGAEKGAWSGRIDQKSVPRFLNKFPSRASESHFYTCGPGEMNDSVAEILREKGIPDSAIHREIFLNADQKSPEGIAKQDGDTCTLEFTLYGQNFTVEMDRSQTILERLIEEGFDPPRSCTSGSCATCMAKKLEGKVTMDVALALEDEELEEGYILTCQSHPTSSKVVIDYDA